MAHSTGLHNPAALTTFGDLLRHLRRRQRLTQVDLAVATGYSTGQIGHLEQNHHLPNPDTLHALFVPALGLDDEPELVARLLDLAHAAYEERDAAGVSPAGEAHATMPATEQDGSSAPAEQPARTTVAATPGGLSGAPLLITKLYVPRPRRDRVARPRLLARLDAALDVPLAVVAAPAGFGKTTLLADWITQGPGRTAWGSGVDIPDPQMLTPGPSVVWIALDDGDNAPTTFLRYLIAAFQTIDPTVGSATLALVQAPQDR